MAVSTTNAFSGPYLTNGVTTVFPFTFTAPTADEVAVILRDAGGEESIPTGFSVTLAEGGGGSAVFAVPPLAGYSLLVLLDPFFTQDLEFENGSAWLAEPVNEGYDRSASRDQVLKRDVDRGLKTPIGEPGLSVPPAAARAGQFPVFGVDGGFGLSFGTGADAGLRQDVASTDAGKGAALIGTPAGVSMQSFADSFGWFSPDSQTRALARAFQSYRQNISADGATADTTALTAWETAVAAYAAGGLTAQTPSLTFGPRRYTLGSIPKKSFGWDGAGQDNARLQYNGVAGADFITQDVTTGRNSAGRISRMSIDGVDCGAIYRVPQNANGYGADDRLRVEEVRFYRGQRQIHLDSYVNFHVNNMRHDNWRDAAVHVVAKLGQNQSSFSHGPGTFDSNSGGGGANPDCFARYDMSALSSTGNIGVVHFHDQRWEMNGTPWSGTKSIISTIATGARQVEYMLTGITIQNTVAGGVDALFHRSQGGSLNAERYNLRGVQMNGITAVFKGDYPAWMIAVPIGNYLSFKGDPINGIRVMRTTSSGPTGEEIYTPAASTTIQQVNGGGALFPQKRERADGLQTGDGTADPSMMWRYAKKPFDVPTGTLNRTTFAAGAASGASAAYVQAEFNSALARIAGVEQRLAALLNDLNTGGSGSPHGAFKPS